MTVVMLNCHNTLSVIGTIACKYDKLKKDLLILTCNGVKGVGGGGGRDVGSCYSRVSPGCDFATPLIKNRVSI